MRAAALVLVALAAARGRIGVQTRGAGESQQVLQAGTAASLREYDGPLGPAIPDACDVGVKTEGGVLDLRTWLGAAEEAAKGRKHAFVGAVHRLCGGRADPGSVAFHKAPPADAGEADSIASSLRALRTACDAGESGEAGYASAFEALCPASSKLGPDMPARCDAVVESPVDGRQVRLLLFLHELRGAASRRDDAAFLAGMRSLCGKSRLETGGARWAEGAPEASAGAAGDLMAALDGMRGACGAVDLDAPGYSAAWQVACPAAGAAPPEAAVPEDTSCDGTVATLDARVAEVTEAGKAILDAFEAAKPHVHDDAARDGVTQAGVGFTDTVSASF